MLRLVSAAMPADELRALVRRALDEDVGSGDVTTTATVSPDARARALITQKAPGAIYGIDVAEATFVLLDPDMQFERLVVEGDWREDGPVLAIEGSAHALLTGERTALNFLGHLSGVATMAARATRAVRGTGAVVLDTRKTTPGLRLLEKAAVAVGGDGGTHNHRVGLYDAILIKENHITAAGGIAQAVTRAREAAPGLADTLEVEVRNPAEIDEALAAGAPRLLLDNMTAAELHSAVAQVAGRAELEASGNVTLDNLRERAMTGVDYISMGALTHSAPALDLSMIVDKSSS